MKICGTVSAAGDVGRDGADAEALVAFVVGAIVEQIGQGHSLEV